MMRRSGDGRIRTRYGLRATVAGDPLAELAARSGSEEELAARRSSRCYAVGGGLLRAATGTVSVSRRVSGRWQTASVQV